MEDILRVVNGSQDAFVERDLERYLSYFREDVVAIDATMRLEGRAQVRAFTAQIYELIARLAFVERRVFVVGETAAQHYKLRLTLANGKETTFEGMDVFELDGERRIFRLTSYYDPAEMQAVLGG